LFDKFTLEKIPARKRFRKTRRRGFFQKKTMYQLCEGEAASPKKKKWLLSHFSGLRGCYCVFTRGLSETEGIEPERRHQNYCHSAVDASAPVMMRLTGWTKHTPVNYVLEADMVNAPAVSPGRSSALAPKPGKIRDPSERMPFTTASWICWSVQLPRPVSLS